MRSKPNLCHHSAFLGRFALPLRFGLIVVAFWGQSLQISAQCIATFPYHEDFEVSQGNWMSGGAGNDWAWGAPNKPTINSAASGLNCWVTGGLTGSFYNLGARSYVESPCFDFTSLAHPYIHFKIWWESERQYDGASFQYTLNDGATWTNVGALNDPVDCVTENWFNTTSITNLVTLANPRNGWSGSIQPTSGSCQGGNGSNGWVTAKHCLNFLAGKPTVRFRFIFGAGTTCNDFDGIAFDDIYIENAPPVGTNFSGICTGNNAFAFTDLSTNCPDKWTWNFGDTNSGTSNTSNLPNPLHTFSGPGLYTVTLQASSSCSGASSFSLPVEVPGIQTSSMPPSCTGGKDGRARILTDTALGNLTIVWNTTPPQFGPLATHLSAGTYGVSVSGNGFCPISAQVVVLDPDPLSPQSNAIIALSDTTIAPGSSVALSGIVADPGRVQSYSWEPSDYLDCATCLNTLATPLQTTQYTLYAEDTVGCRVSDVLTIKVLQGTVYIPNIFKPGSDDGNDHFTVFAAKDVEQIELLQVYDRWGSLVFENAEFPASNTAFGWDGSINGAQAASGVYGYLIKIRFVSGASEWFHGDVTVVR